MKVLTKLIKTNKLTGKKETVNDTVTVHVKLSEAINSIEKLRSEVIDTPNLSAVCSVDLLQSKISRDQVNKFLIQFGYELRKANCESNPELYSVVRFRPNCELA